MNLDSPPRVALLAQWVVALGVLAVVFAALLTFGIADQVEADATVVGYRMPDLLYVGGEALLSAAFAGWAAWLLASRATPELLWVVAGGRVVVLAASILGNWDPGWYYLLDPAAAPQLAYAVLGLGVAQAVLLCSMAVIATRGRAEG